MGFKVGLLELCSTWWPTPLCPAWMRVSTPDGGKDFWVLAPAVPLAPALDSNLGLLSGLQSSFL